MSVDWLSLSNLPLTEALALLVDHGWPLFIAASLAGLLDSIGGGGGLITVPTLLSLGLPPSLLLGSNKCISCFGSLPAAWRYKRAGLLPALAPGLWIALFLGVSLCSIVGAYLSQKQLILDHLHFLVPCLLFSVMAFMLKRWFWDERKLKRAAQLGPDDIDSPLPLTEALSRPTARLGLGLIGTYDGLFGPGTGTFFLSLFERLGLKTISANAMTKIFNLASNGGALLWFTSQQKVLWPLGLAGAFFYLCGNYIGAGLVLRKGQGLIRIIVMLASSGLLIKHLFRYL